jgi:DDE superfamily endonuclease
MWCVAALTAEYRKRMYHLLALYARPERKDEPVVCIDEKSLQLLADSRAPVAMKPGRLRKEDYEYVRRGTVNLFVAVEPKAGRREVEITERRGKSDFVAFVQNLLNTTYKAARCLHLVVDNLNTHFKKSFVDTLGKREAAEVLRRVRFHYTPKHASWLNMAEIEIGVLTRQCLNRRFSAAGNARAELQSNISTWQARRNGRHKPLNWKFTRKKADAKFGHKYVS